MKINDVIVCVHNLADLEKIDYNIERADEQFLRLLDEQELWWTNTCNWQEVAAIAGYDTNKIDWAVPQPWVDQQRVKPFDYCWYYGPNSRILGEPLKRTDILQQAKNAIVTELLRRGMLYQA